MSFEPGTLMVFHVLVFILELTQITERMGVLSVAREDGDTRWKALGVRELPKYVMWGSCIRTTSHCPLKVLLRMSRCAPADLLRFICRIRILFVFVSAVLDIRLA